MSEVTEFFITDSAADRINHLVKTEDEPGAMLRIEVEGGGCSGFQYHFDFTWDKKADDLIFEHNGATILIDPISLDFIKGSQLDYVVTLGAAAFEIKNPNATAQCGCGNSFSV